MSSRDELVARAERLHDRVNGHPEQVAEVVPALGEMLSLTDDPDVLVAVAEALGAAWTDAASAMLLPFATHPDEGVRLAVTRALPGGIESADVIGRVADALIALSDDTSPDVRDWASFGLGSILEIDTPAVREALRARLFDSDIDTRLEALVGLAERHDAAAFDLVVEALQADIVERLVLDAARALADPRLLPHLGCVSPRDSIDRAFLNAAMEACKDRRDGPETRA